MGNILGRLANLGPVIDPFGSNCLAWEKYGTFVGEVAKCSYHGCGMLNMTVAIGLSAVQDAKEFTCLRMNWPGLDYQMRTSLQGV